MIKNKLPLRIGVGAIVLNNENKVFVGKRKDNPIDKWQMPQGGVNENEDYIPAMRRELFEETSIKNIKILKEIDRIYEYEKLYKDDSGINFEHPSLVGKLSKWNNVGMIYKTT